VPVAATGSEAMSKLKRIDVEEGVYFITTRLLRSAGIQLDGQTLPIMYELINFYLGRDKFKIYGFVFMPDHFHWVIQPAQNGNCSQIMHHLKRKFSIRMGEKLGCTGSIWQRRFYDHGVRDEKDLRTKIEYMHQNPWRAGLVEDIEDYPFSSYAFYSSGKDAGIPIAPWPV
jgi:putative transposase